MKFRYVLPIILVATGIVLCLDISSVKLLRGAELETELSILIKDYVDKGNIASVGPSITEIIQSRASRPTVDDPKKEDDISCPVCRAVVNTLINLKRSGVAKNLIQQYLEQLCPTYDLNTKFSCDGLVERKIDTILYILDRKINTLDGLWVCSIILQNNRCFAPHNKTWTIDVPEGSTLKQARDAYSLHTKILQISDIHYDFLYKPNNEAECNEPTCCYKQSNNTTASAGYWGDYRPCDIPWHTVENAFQQIKSTPNVSHIYFTGDIIHHRTWMTTPEDISRDFRKVFDLFKQEFPGITVYPILGNHEVHPVNDYPPVEVSPEHSIRWLFELAATEWSQWLPTTALETIRKGGYYTVKVNDKFRIIALNGNVCYIHNLWLIYDDVDPYGQLRWLQDVLSHAEADKEYVHILTHIPSGSGDCHLPWAREYRKIINRYANTIKAAFTGHTHMNDMQLFYNATNSSDLIYVAYNGGSVTTFSELNPNYVVYQIHQNNMEVEDVEWYTYNLTAANANGNPQWYKLYSFKSLYNLEDLSLPSLNKFVRKLASNRTMLELYDRYKYKNSDPFLKNRSSERLLQTLCGLVSSLAFDRTQCDILSSIWESAKASDTTAN